MFLKTDGAGNLSFSSDLPTTSFTGATVETSIADSDLVLIYDDSATAVRKMTKANLVAGIGGGLSEADQWRLSANFDIPTTGTVVTNWEISDEPSFSRIGTGMTQSSGIFTFPSTGYYLVTFYGQVFSSDYASTNAFVYIEATLDNSTYNNVSLGWIGYKGGANPISRTTTSCSAIIDVTNTTNVKVRFLANDNDNVTIGLEGDTNLSYTSATFIKLGNT